MKAFTIKECKECGSDDLSWDYSVGTSSGIQDGRLQVHDIQVKYFLGCNHCSETLAVVRADEVSHKINILQGFVS